ncbi:LysR family transcriptional regulator [Roseibium algae]|uniref:LysR family transcriptional regulator n=1 Tax=Roseibium algae TaxID=3123038 RepID=A0ABU8TQR1_9HYPH
MMDRLPPFDLIDLRLLLALSEHRHFARAAAACGLSQPALSARIRRLETALATPLIFRGKRFEGFTPEGARILAWSRRILSDCGGLVQDLSSSESPSGNLRMGVVPSAAPYAGKLCGAVASCYPDMTFRLLSMSSDLIEAGLDDFSLDAGLTYLNKPDVTGRTSITLYDEKYSLVAAQSFVLPKGDEDGISWKAAAELPLCLLTEDMQNRRIIDTAFHSAGVSPVPRFESNSFNAILALVRQGGLVTILPRLQVEQGLSAGSQVLELVEPDISASLGLVVPTREPALPVSSALLAAVPEILKDF